ncbi:MAG: deoxyribose-phosphate aldolase [Candidatus Hydrothermarchaeaceae archaeon]
MDGFTKKDLAGMMDYSLLHAGATAEYVVKACDEAKKYGFHSVCINPSYIEIAKRSLEDSGVKVTAVLAYPLGATLPEVKAFEALEYVNRGADELDMVMDIGAFKSGDLELVEKEIKWVVEAGLSLPRTVTKVIIETGLLTEDEIVTASKLVKKAGADFVKSGTGWGKGTSVRDVTLMRKAVGARFGVKAAGGIKTLKQTMDLVNAGANRIGTSSAVEIMKEFRLKKRG